MRPISTDVTRTSLTTPTGTDKTVILVTGGYGLVGRAIMESIKKENAVPGCIKTDQGKSTVEEWHFCSSKDADLRNYEETRTLINERNPDVVLHLAADVGGLYKNMSSQIQMLRNNSLINDSVQSVSAKNPRVKKIISCLSTCIFPEKCSYPIDESMIHKGEPHPSNFGYAYAKRMVDIYNRAYTESCRDKVFTSVIPTNIFGPHDNFNLETGHVIPSLIHKCYLAKKNNTEFVIAGSGEPLRQFIYSKDLALLMIWAVRNYSDPTPIIFAPSELDEISIKSVVKTIAEAMGFTGTIRFDTSLEDGQYKKTASNKKLQQLVPGFSFTPFDTAIKETIDWFTENYHTCKK